MTCAVVRSQSYGRSLGVMLLAGAALSAWSQSPGVPTVVVQPKSVTVAYALDGAVQAVRQSTIASQASGRIATFLVRAGDKVRAGQVLATVDDREAVAGVQRSQAQINQADAEWRNAQANLARTKDLQGKGFVSRAALDTADAQAKSAQALREQATAVALQSGIAQSFTRITAPFDGWVMQTHAEAGDLSVPGKPIVTVYAPQPLRVVVQVPSSRAELARTAVQTAVQVGDATGSSAWITPTERSALPSADPISQTTEWRLELPAKDSIGLVPGQQAHVRFTPQQVSAALHLRVPAAAIVRRGELTAVYMVAGGVFNLRAVRLGSSQGGDGVEVLAGLRAGDVIALDPIRAGFANAKPLPAPK